MPCLLGRCSEEAEDNIIVEREPDFTKDYSISTKVIFVRLCLSDPRRIRPGGSRI